MTDEMELAPVYDCGSSLYPQADDKIMTSVLANEKERDFRIFEIPTSAVMINGKKIKYFDFISSLQIENCRLEEPIGKGFCDILVPTKEKKIC